MTATDRVWTLLLAVVFLALTLGGGYLFVHHDDDPVAVPRTMVVADTVRNVTCWIRTDAGGIACLPNQFITR